MKKILICVEGQTEKAFKKIILDYLKDKLSGQMPKITFSPYKGLIPLGQKLKSDVDRHLLVNDYVIILTDVQPNFKNIQDAKIKFTSLIKSENCYVHVASYEFEAWLLPHWQIIQKIAGYQKSIPKSPPETINSENPPAKRIHEIFKLGGKHDYNKPTHGYKVLSRSGALEVSMEKCPELKAFIDRIVELASK